MARLVREQPGICIRDVCRQTGINYNTVKHHVRCLVGQGAILSRKVGKYRCLFSTETRFDEKQMVVHGLLRCEEQLRRIVEAIRARPGIAQKAIRETRGLSPRSAHACLERLRDAGVVVARREGRFVTYRLRDGIEDVLP